MFKIIEKSIHIHYQLQDYNKENGVLSKYQSDFRANYSTDSCPLQLADFVLTSRDKGMHTGMILKEL